MTVKKTNQTPMRRVIIRLFDRKNADYCDDSEVQMSPYVLAKFNCGQIERHPDRNRMSIFIQEDHASAIMKKIDMTRKLYIIFLLVCYLVFM